MVLCTFYNKDYKTKYTLKIHQSRSACVKNKPDFVNPILFKCKICNKDFTNKRNYQSHEIKCELKQVPSETLESVKIENTVLKTENNVLRTEIYVSKNKIELLIEENKNARQQIEDLKELMFRLTDKTTIITNLEWLSASEYTKKGLQNQNKN